MLGVHSFSVKPLDLQQCADAVRQIGLYWLWHNQTPTL
jgi:hypothetical protein